MKELEKSQQEVERSRDDGLETFRNEREAVNLERLKVTYKREKLT